MSRISATTAQKQSLNRYEDFLIKLHADDTQLSLHFEPKIVAPLIDLPFPNLGPGSCDMFQTAMSPGTFWHIYHQPLQRALC